MLYLIFQFLREILENTFMLSSHTARYFFVALLLLTFYRKKPGSIKGFLDTVSGALSDKVIENQKIIVYGLVVAGTIYTVLPEIGSASFGLAAVPLVYALYESWKNEIEFEEKSRAEYIAYMHIFFLVLVATFTFSYSLGSLVAVYLFAIIFIKI